MDRLKGIVPSTKALEEVDTLEVAPQAGGVPARWIITASNGLEPQQGNFTDACSVTVVASSEAEALTKARALVQRHWYRVSAVEEVGG